jgi:flagellar biosynthesis protein FlhA
MSMAINNPLLYRLHQHRGMFFPVAAISLLFVIIVPLPTGIMDVLLVLNIALAALILITTIHVLSPLELSVFPSLLLATTLMRLVLNIATTRLILTVNDRAATPETALVAAGGVIHAFSEFVTGGSLAVGLIIFVIIIVIQFLVITKGATRISEVAARFTLDAMPGKQMAIDADVNAGVISEVDARRRRDAIAQEADFYGAMDGASKFVRGDAIAGIIIVLVNILAGLYVGMVQQGWQLMPCLDLYTRLTIGDGLAAQIPAFLVSLSAGLIVTRASGRSNLGEEMIGQVIAKPKALIITGAFLALLTLTSMPTLPLVIMGACCGGLAWIITRSEKRAVIEAASDERERAAASRKEPDRPEKFLDLDTLELEIGYGLVRLVDAGKGGDLLNRITMIRQQIAGELGIIIPPIRIRDNYQLLANDYVMRIRGQAIARGVAYPEQFLAMDNPTTAGAIAHAEETIEPAFGLKAYWITESQRPQAEMLNYTVVDATSVLATHLTEIIKAHAAELLGRQDVKNLLDNLKNRSPALVEEVIPTQIKVGELQRVCQNLLRERVPVRDLESIVQTLGDFASRTRDLDVLTEYVRNALARSICKQYVDERDQLWCITLDPALEELIAGHLERGEHGTANTMPPRTAQQVVQQVEIKVAEVLQSGRQAVVLCGPHIRQALRRMIEGRLPHLPVLAYNEVVPEVTAEAVAVVGLNG